jgi:hypothetical protein
MPDSPRVAGGNPTVGLGDDTDGAGDPVGDVVDGATPAEQPTSAARARPIAANGVRVRISTRP